MTREELRERYEVCSTQTLALMLADLLHAVEMRIDLSELLEEKEENMLDPRLDTSAVHPGLIDAIIDIGEWLNEPIPHGPHVTRVRIITKDSPYSDKEYGLEHDVFDYGSFHERRPDEMRYRARGPYGEFNIFVNECVPIARRR